MASILSFPPNPGIGQVYQSDTLHNYIWNGYAWDLVENGVLGTPRGIIYIWSGLISEIPNGWVLCDGQFGSPDLRQLFGMCATNNQDFRATGGSRDAITPSHTHNCNTTSSVNDPGHTHTFYHQQGGAPLVSGHEHVDRDGTLNTGRSITGVTISVNTTLSTEGVDPTDKNMPPYYTLAYIMKL
jgi:microcystin-dependent protein